MDPTANILTCDFGIKSSSEVTYDGQVGLLLEGYASRYGEVDADGETQMPGSFGAVAEEIVDPADLPILLEHGADPLMGTRRVGKTVDYRHDDTGLFVRVFVPRDWAERFTGAAKSRFKQMYANIKGGVTRGFSVGGVYRKGRDGKSIQAWNLLELSICNRPCLATATFTLGRKAIVDEYGDVPLGISEGAKAMDPYDDPASASLFPSPSPMLTRPHWTRAMEMAQRDGDVGLHDTLLARPDHVQGTHDADACAICTDRRASRGMKTDGGDGEDDDGDGALSQGAKALTKTVGDDDLPVSAFLSVPNPFKPSTWGLPVRGPDGKPDHGRMGAAAAALGPDGYRGNRYAGDDKAEALAKLKALYKSEGMDWPHGADSNSNSGKKGAAGVVAGDGAQAVSAPHLNPTDLPPDVIDAALAILNDYEAGVKAGKRHSKETRDAVRHVMRHLNTFFGLGYPLPAVPMDDHDGDDSDTPAPVVVAS